MRSSIVTGLLKQGAMGVLRMRSSDRIPRVAEALAAGGLRYIEITMTVPGALASIRSVCREIGKDAVIGVGSVLDGETVRRAFEAGARFVVSPVHRIEVVHSAHELEIPAISGAFSPSEIQRAHDDGSDIVKVFPADVLGPGYLRSVLAPMPDLKLMPTGGVTPHNAGEWIRSGACCVAVGSALLDDQAIEDERYSVLTEKARLLVRNVRTSLEA